MIGQDDLEGLVAVCDRMLKDGQDIESILLFLRNHYDKKTIAVAVIARLLSITLGESKSLVHSSETWSNVQQRDEEFEQDVVTTLKRLE